MHVLQVADLLPEDFQLSALRSFLRFHVGVEVLDVALEFFDFLPSATVHILDKIHLLLD